MTKATKFIDPVILSGADLGGTLCEGKGWIVGTEKIFSANNKSYKYRRLEDDDNGLTSDQAVFSGMSK